MRSLSEERIVCWMAVGCVKAASARDECQIQGPKETGACRCVLCTDQQAHVFNRQMGASTWKRSLWASFARRHQCWTKNMERMKGFETLSVRRFCQKQRWKVGTEIVDVLYESDVTDNHCRNSRVQRRSHSLLRITLPRQSTSEIASQDQLPLLLVPCSILSL